MLGQNGRLESWKLWIFQVPVEGQATKWPVGELETLDFSGPC